jgi:hypothetical protein
MLRLQSFFSNNCDVVCLYAHLPLLQHRKRFVSSIGPTVAYMSFQHGARKQRHEKFSRLHAHPPSASGCRVCARDGEESLSLEEN